MNLDGPGLEAARGAAADGETASLVELLQRRKAEAQAELAAL